MSEQISQPPQPKAQTHPPNTGSQSPKAQAATEIAKPDKNAVVPEYVLLANERTLNE